MTGALWLVPAALLPLVVGAAIDDGVVGGDRDALLLGAGVVVAIGLSQMVTGGLLDFLAHGMWMHGGSAVQRVVAGHTTRLGASLRAQAGTGDVMAVSSSDVNHVGSAFEVLGRFAGAVLAFAAVGVVLLTRAPLLGAVALVGVPLAVLGLGVLLGPLQRRKDAQRERLAEVNALGADIVAGLRILRGVGGERQFLDRFRAASGRVRRAGVDVVRSESWLQAAEVLLPGLVTVVILWLGARLAAAGELGVGELIAFYGASAFLVVPVQVAAEAVGSLASARASARTACRLLALRPLLDEPDAPQPLPPGPLGLSDSATGFDATAATLTVVAAAPGGVEALAARLARLADPAPGQRSTVGGVPTGRVAAAELRSRVVLAHREDVWFSGVLREQLAPARPGGVTIAEALHAADADDIVRGLPRGLDEWVGERGREVSGGQRQRLALARALMTDADVLLLDEPTSAVDAHTEARIAERVAALRRGRTTVVFGGGPLWRAVADRVDGAAAAQEDEEAPAWR